MKKMWLLPIICFTITTLTTSSLITDQSSLLTFKSHINFDPHNILAQNWSTSTSCCTWIGITCTSRHNRVISLQLPNMGLNGTLPPHLGNLSFLSFLDLTNNTFYGGLPRELVYLRRLKALYLGYNNFTGEVELPFSLLPNLQLIYLNNNNFQGPIPTDIYKCTQLKYLALSVNYFTGTISREIGNLTMLKILYLTGNNLEGVIPQEIGKLINLEILSLIYCGLTGSIPREIGNLTLINELYLNQNHLEGSIPREIGNLTLIKWLVLGNNFLKGAMPHEMGTLRNLEILDLRFNNLTGPIPSKIFNITSMRSIQLYSNHLSGQLPSDLWLPNLEELLLWENELQGTIPNSITNASSLVLINLAKNLFTGFVPNTLYNLRSLELFVIQDNFLTLESSTLDFLTSLTNCKYLRTLVFSNNPLAGILPPSIRNFSMFLQNFYASSCKIKGSIPIEIGNLSSLIGLNLRTNELSGSIPTTIGSLQKLQGLYLQQNKLQGSIPNELCHLRTLVYLYLNENELFGSIPACIGNITSLSSLNLDSNSLSAPPAFWSLVTYILVLNLSTNALTGNLPAHIGNFKNVINIDLSKNQLSGDIPSTIGGLQELVSLNLAHNRLQGPIPQSFEKLLSLEYLDLSNNTLFGVIPKSLEALKYLKYFNVSFNRLEGEIPNEGPFVNFSAQSFMMNDALCGSARLQVPTCKTILRRQSKTTLRSLLKYIIPTIAAVAILVAIILVMIRHRKRNVRLPTQADSLRLALRRIPYQELLQATNGFCESNLLGIGSFGSVYKGILPTGVNVAIKVFNMQVEGAFKSFDAECEVLRNTRHRNLLKIISSCSNLDFKSLVLEYMPNGSLEKWLYSHNYNLDFQQRLNIMIDVASALEYLHHGTPTPIIHCDIKPSNILLDEDMGAHVADFGIAKLLGEEETMTQTKTLATIGYMAPEYGSEGVVSTRGDVYSYGILMMETFTRKKPTNDMFIEEMSLIHWVQNSLREAEIENVVDPNLLKINEQHLAVKKEFTSSILELALACSAEVPGERIDMKSVLITLNNIRTKFQKGVVTTQDM